MDAAHFDLNDKRNLKIVVVVLSILFCLVLFKWSQVRSENKDLIKLYEKKLQDEIAEKEKAIAVYKKEILVSKSIISDLEDRQDQYEHSLDSLAAIKQKVKKIYIDRIIELNDFNSVEVENYWRNKFRIDE